MTDIHKTFQSSGVKALCGASLFVEEGTIHALLGENGAGKTTLMRILVGLEKPDRGIIKVFGRTFSPKSPKDALKAGVTMVHQNLSIIDEFTVLENVMVGEEPTKFLWNYQKAKRLLIETMEKSGLYIDPDRKIGALSLAEKQKVEILRALLHGARIIIFDEPTSYLSEEDFSQFQETIRKLRDANHTVILITHNIDEVLAVADHVTILRTGNTILSKSTKSTTKDELISAMVGEYEPLHLQNDWQKGEEILRIENLHTKDGKLRGVSFSLNAGEIVGLIGFTNNGQKELFQSIMGLKEISAGRILFFGKMLNGLTTREIRKLGISYIPEDRTAEGISLDSSILENIVATRYLDFSKMGWLSLAKCEQFTKDVLSLFDVKVSSPKQPVRFLSGGNLQKLIISRETYENPKLLLACEPTAGLDVRSIMKFYKRLQIMKRAGSSVIISSNDYDEIIKICDRFLFIVQGKIVAEMVNQKTTKKKIFSTLMAASSAGG